MATTAEMRGGCLCGAVTFSVRGGSKWCAHCHCTMCRRAHGAGYVTWVGVQDEHFGMEQDAGALRWYHSSEQAQRGFCSVCGSTLFFRSGRWPGEIHIARANFHGEIDRAPQAHVFFDTHVDWMPMDRDLPVLAVQGTGK